MSQVKLPVLHADVSTNEPVKPHHHAGHDDAGGRAGHGDVGSDRAPVQLCYLGAHVSHGMEGGP